MKTKLISLEFPNAPYSAILDVRLGLVNMLHLVLPVMSVCNTRLFSLAHADTNLLYPHTVKVVLQHFSKFAGSDRELVGLS